jgi:long-chain fatty acid transport protein
MAMDGKRKFLSIALAATLAAGVQVSTAQAQGYGSDLQNVMMPAAGGMAGVSLARPQDVPSAIFGNPASLTEFNGTQFTFGGGWVEGYPTVFNDGSLNGGTPFNVTSRTEGFVAPSIGVTQSLECYGRPVTFGMGLGSLSGLGSEFRDRAPGTILNNFSSQYLVLGLNAGAGVQVTDRLSLGASVTLGTAFEQLGFVGPLTSSAMVNGYALRATLGADWDINDCNTLGVFWQSKMDFQFSDAVRFNGNYANLDVDQPTTVGFGLANRAFMDGNLLIAGDVYYKMWDSAALWQDVLVNQWAFAVGAQYTMGCYKYRLGYSYNTNPINHNVGANLDGFPVLQQNVQLFQAAAAAFVNQNRITAGIGREGFLVPNLDVDLFVGGLFKASDNFGPDTRTSLAIWYTGLGMTWKFGDCSPRPGKE